MGVSYIVYNRQHFDSCIADHQNEDMNREAIPPVARYALKQLVIFNGRKTSTSLVFEFRVNR